MKSFNKLMIVLVVAIGLILIGSSAQASLKQMKEYKGAFPDAKPKCVNCHVSEMPKKDDGQHELNDYGKAVIKAAGAQSPSADTYKTVGKVEDFKK